MKLDGIGSFALSVQCHKTGVDAAEKVDPYKQITNIKVQFRPERESILVAGERKVQTTLVANDITWVEIQERKGTKNAGDGTPSGDPSTGSETGEEPGGNTGGGDTSGGNGGGGNNGGDDPFAG